MTIQSDYACIDFETYYAKDYGLRDMPTWQYVNDPRFDAYLVAVDAPGYEFVEHPSKFDWAQMHGKIAIAHNASFDELVFNRLKQLGRIPAGVEPKRWVDTADMAAYLKVKRNLKDAAHILLGLQMDKTMRDKMKGISADEAKQRGWWPEMLKYGGTDARNARLLYEKFIDQWPLDEQRLSELNRYRGWRGIAVDVPLLDEYSERIAKILFDLEAKIPWEWEDEGYKTPLAPVKIREECRKAGIPCPASFAKDSEDCAEWEALFSNDYPFVFAIREWRIAYAFKGKLDAVRERLRPDGTIPYSCKYFGAHTGRQTAEEGFNVLNMYRNLVFGMDFRKLFIARPGKQFILADLAQIEPRMLAFMAGDKEFLRLCATMSPYQAHALQTMGYKGANLKKEDPKTYAAAKGRVISLGYGAGWKKFIVMLRNYGIVPEEIFTDPVTDSDEQQLRHYIRNKPEDLKLLDKMKPEQKQVAVNAWKQVQDYRAKSQYVTALWKRYDFGLKFSANHGENYEVQLPSGRWVAYYNPKFRGDSVLAQTTQGGKTTHFYGGKIAENCIAKGTEVLTNNGWKPIENIGLNDLIHDGLDFVRHGGVVCKQIQGCVTVDGVYMTPDHEVLTYEGWKTALEKPEPYRPNIRETNRHSSSRKRRKENELGISLLLREISGKSRCRCDRGMPGRLPCALRVLPVSTQEHTARNVETSGFRSMVLHVSSLFAKDSSSMEKLRGTRNNCLQKVGELVRKFLGRYGPGVQNGSHVGQNKQQPGVLQEELPLGDSQTECTEHSCECNSGVGAGFGKEAGNKAIDIILPSNTRGSAKDSMHSEAGCRQEVFDILDCGPRHRFVVTGTHGPFIVHNCCQAASRDYFVQGDLRLEDAGYHSLWTVYDEYAIEHDDASEKSLKEIKEIICDKPGWAKDLPIDVDISVTPHYKK